MTDHPNLLYVLTDQWRAQATGYAGDPNVRTPHLDALAAKSWNFATAVANCPVCCPARATLLTGLLPDRHGVVLNDVHLDQRFTSLADCFNAAGYRTGWIGKWHVDGRGRKSYIPPQRRQGFSFFQACECCHDYNDSVYFDNDDPTPRRWEGYDAFAQTEAAIRFMEECGGQPFALVLSWGPPHFPYQTAPESYRRMYDPAGLTLRPNVPPESEAEARKDLAGYYAHCTALDDAMGRLLEYLERSARAEDTMVVFTSDHGDMLGSQGQIWKQRPWDESILVPLLIRPPRAWDQPVRPIAEPVGLVDYLPTFCGLCGMEVPKDLPGRDLAPLLRSGAALGDEGQLIACYTPFADWERRRGGREYRGIRTMQYTYARTLDGPWLLHDNADDPYQLRNLVDEQPALRDELDGRLGALLERVGDAFLPGEACIEQWGHPVNEHGTVPYGP